MDFFSVKPCALNTVPANANSRGNCFRSTLSLFEAYWKLNDVLTFLIGTTSGSEGKNFLFLFRAIVLVIWPVVLLQNRTHIISSSLSILTT